PRRPLLVVQQREIGFQIGNRHLIAERESQPRCAGNLLVDLTVTGEVLDLVTRPDVAIETSIPVSQMPCQQTPELFHGHWTRWPRPLQIDAIPEFSKKLDLLSRSAKARVAEASERQLRFVLEHEILIDAEIGELAANHRAEPREPACRARQ